MSVSTSKFSTVSLITDHYRTLRNARTDRVSAPDLLVFVGLPAALAVLCWVKGLRAEEAGDVLAAVAILTGLIFNVFVLLFDLTMRAKDSSDSAYLHTIMTLADELRSNVTYAVLIGITTTALLAGLVMFGEKDKPLAVLPTSLVVFFGVQLLLTIFMILKRVRALYRAFHVAQHERIP